LKLPDFFGGGKPKARDAKRLRRTLTANEFVNVKDVRGPVLIGKDGHLFAFLRIRPVSLDLLSPREKERKIKSFAAEFSAEKKDFKFFSISRPADIKGLSARLAGLLAEATDTAQRDLREREIREVSAFALTGEVTERQFYLIVWENASDAGSPRNEVPWGEGGEKELLRRARELENRFSRSEIAAELCDRAAVTRLLNLFANPGYAHSEDDDISPAIPFLSFAKGGASFEND
jgi:hypothetical protein